MVPVWDDCCLCGILGVVHVIVGEFVGIHSWGLESFVLVEIVQCHGLNLSPGRLAYGYWNPCLYA